MVESTPRPVPTRRGLGPALTVFLVVDVLLVLAVLVALAAFLSGGAREPAGGPGAASTSSATPGAGDAPAPSPTAAPGGTTTFALPSGNIACRIADAAATCTVADSTAEPVVVEGCAGTAGQVVTVTAEGVDTPCVQGALPGPAAPGTPVLDYGESTTTGDFTCASATTGVTCRHDPTGAGFTLARAGHTVLDPDA